VVATDYAYALERMLAPQTASPLSAYFAGIRGAREFVNACKTERHGQEPLKAGDPPRAGHGSGTAHVAGINAMSPDKLVIELEQPDPTFAYVLAILFAAQPREEVERPGGRFSVRPVGSGPYVVAEWTRGVRLVLTPNPHDAGRLPRHFDRIEIMIGGDVSTHLMMFERGELDIADIEWFTLPIADHRRITHHSRWRPYLEESRVEYAVYVVLNTEMPPLDHLEVRQALNYAVNKPRCVRTANGRVEPATGILPPFVPGYNSNLVGYPYDPEKAKALLVGSGMAQPIWLTLWHPRDFELAMVAQGIQSDLHGIGVEVELKEVTSSELNSAIMIRGKVPMALTGWISIMPDPKDLLSSLFDGRTITNTPTTDYAFYNNPEVNRLLDEAATNVILSARYALYQRAEEIIVRDAPFVFLGYPKVFALKQPWIKGRLIEPLWPFRLDRVWIER
jgi:peptide/nickel transport system substrate-binding protein/oligopeptide transport system substrate-binding protein